MAAFQEERKKFEEHKAGLMEEGEGLTDGSQGDNVTVHVQEDDGQTHHIGVKKSYLKKLVNEDEEVRRRKSAMEDEMNAMRERLAKEREALVEQLKSRKSALQSARRKTGINLEADADEAIKRANDANEAKAAAAKQAEEEAAAKVKQEEEAKKVAAEQAAKEAKNAEEKKIGEDKMRLMEHERRALEAELAAERARFQIEKQRMQDEMRGKGAPASPQAAEASPSPTGDDPLVQMKAVLEAERAAQEAKLEAERARLEQALQKERLEMEAKLAKEKQEMEEKLTKKVAKQEKADTDRAQMENEIAQTLKMFQMQLQMQQQQMQQIQQSATTPGSAQTFSTAMGGQPGVPVAATAPVAASAGGPVNPFAPPGVAQPAQSSAVDAPTQEEIVDYAVYLGMDPEADKELLYIAEWALTAPLPDGWTEHSDASGNEFYYNAMTGVSTYEHPLDEQYRSYYRQIKEQQASKSVGDSAQAALAS